MMYQGTFVGSGESISKNKGYTCDFVAGKAILRGERRYFFMMSEYTKINSKTWDLWSENGCEWFGDLKGKKLLGLASGGGQQIPVFSKLGASCTIFDYSDRQLAAERMVAEREGYSVEIIKGDMTKRLPFADESFDIIFHPVSNCYIENVYHVWNECFRVLKKGGRLLAGFSNGLDFLFEDDNALLVVNRLPFNPLKMPRERFEAMANNGEGIQFSHSMEEQIGGQLKAGFTLKALYEDRDREGGAKIREYAPQYMATLAVK